MKKAFILLIVLMMTGASLASNIAGIEVKKSVNDGYEVSMPVWLDMQSQLPFLPKSYLKIKPIFTAPRGEFFGSMGSLNHSRLDLVVGSGITLLGGKLEAETGLTNWWAGNNEGIPEGMVWSSAMRYYFEWD